MEVVDVEEQHAFSGVATTENTVPRLKDQSPNVCGVAVLGLKEKPRSPLTSQKKKAIGAQ